MIIKYTQEEYDNAKSGDKLRLQCEVCQKIFYSQKKKIKSVLSGKTPRCCSSCSTSCGRRKSNVSKGHKLPTEIFCKNCGKKRLKKNSEIKKCKNHFCSSSCAATYNNKHKAHGTRRSKLEAYIEEQLLTYFPDLDIIYNGKEAIGSELDIYAPSLNLAFEINGIFHYEPIFGKEKLSKIERNDRSKSLACINAEIDLCIIDTSQHKYIKPSTSQKYIDIIVKIINDRLSS